MGLANLKRERKRGKSGNSVCDTFAPSLYTSPETDCFISYENTPRPKSKARRPATSLSSNDVNPDKSRRGFVLVNDRKRETVRNGQLPRRTANLYRKKKNNTSHLFFSSLFYSAHVVDVVERGNRASVIPDSNFTIFSRS